MKNLIPVEGFNNLERDCITGAVIQSSENEYQNYLKVKSKKEQDSAKIDNALNEISILKSEISEIKNILLSLGKQNGTI